MLASLLTLWLGATAPDCNAKLVAYGRELRPQERVSRMDFPLPSGTVFAAAGMDHLANQREALSCALGLPAANPTPAR